MLRRNSAPILVICSIYLIALLVTTGLLVFWVAVVQRFEVEINQMIGRLGLESNYFHWFVGTTGYGLFFLVILALTYLLAVTLSERRYSRKQNDFLSNVTHELKSPVAAIKLHAQSLEQSDVPRDERARSVGYILQEAERIGALVDNLLESSRLEASAGGRLEAIDLRAFFADYQNAVRGRFDLARIDLRFEVSTRSAVMATAEGLQRILDNLISNAVRFTHRGGRILLTVRDRGRGRAEIVVADDGVGIPKRDLERIFDRFHQLGHGLRGHHGTGLGLSIVRGLVEELRGRIRAVTPEGNAGGARFEIELPTSAGHSANPRPKEPTDDD